MKAGKCLAAVACAACVMLAIAYTGYVHSYLDHEVQTTFFLKRYPTLQLQFYDPYANEGDDAPVDRLPPLDRSRFADYCKYRFGITDPSTEILEACKAKIPTYL
ncbi:MULTISPECIES: hypothetical protein [Paraburkholderia]|uniref:Uncharacterized protein n=1 Tax=Paraburkholderia podalyriae TaxID=1938811 RepID=A0ABR7PRU0_9BURK|nr:hypothetical protein [Paraburkholderia podalyriae]MBC8748975.1 hypothetical protein [Paraburkholderia podalyriae]